MRITVIVTEEEHAKIKKAAGLIPLSAYLKAAVLATIDDGWLRTDAKPKGKRG